MQYRYRVVGKVTQPFILRGAYFVIGSKIEFYIAESELDFVKARCELEKVEDLQKVAEPANSVSESKKTPEIPSKRQYNKKGKQGI